MRASERVIEQVHKVVVGESARSDDIADTGRRRRRVPATDKEQVASRTTLGMERRPGANLVSGEAGRQYPLPAFASTKTEVTRHKRKYPRGDA